MLDKIEKTMGDSQNNTSLGNKAEWQAPSLTKLDVSQTQGGLGVDDEASDSKAGS